MAGKRQPTDLIKANGRKHLSRAEEQTRREGEVNACTDKQVRAPSWLPEDLRKEFNEIAKRLIDLKIFCKLDRDTLGRYLIAQREYLKAGTLADEAIAAANVKEAEAWVGVQDKYFKQARASANDLGLTITSRCALVVPQKEPDSTAKDPFLVLLESKKA